MSSKLTHFDETGRPQMVDVTKKNDTSRRAVASGRVVLSPSAYNLVTQQGVEKGDIGKVAELAGIMGAKRTADLIPLCHPLPITGLSVAVDRDDASHALVVSAEVKTTAKTGVEMEALTAVSVACLTIYDMVKAIDKAIVIRDIALMEKSGGKSGDYRREE